MGFNVFLTSLTAYLGLGAAGAVVLFGISVALDNVEGVLLSTVKGHDENGVAEKFDIHKLGSFLDSQFGTQKAKIVLAAVVAAVVAAVLGQVLAGASEEIVLRAAETVALSTAIAGSIAQFASVASDAVANFRALVAK